MLYPFSVITVFRRTSSVILESASFHELSENGIYPSFFTDSDIVLFAIPRTFTVPSDNVLYCIPPTVTTASCIGEPDTSTTVIVLFGKSVIFFRRNGIETDGVVES